MDKILAESRPVESLDLFITERCNLSCSYCFHTQSPADLTLEEGMKIMDNMCKVSPDRLTITFFGGEPMLNFPLVLALARYARAIWPKKGSSESVAFNMCTNGTIFDEKFFVEFGRLGGKVQISLDGDKETSEATRCGINFEEVESNVRKILRILPGTGVRMTFTPENVGKLTQNVTYLHKLGFNSIMHHAVIEAAWTDDAVKQYEYQLRQIYSYRRHVLRNGGNLWFHFIDRDLKLLNGEVTQETNYCEAGQGHLAVLPGGDVFICHRAASARKFKLGNLFSDSMPIIRGMFLNLNKNTTGCSKNCHSVTTCHSCPYMHHIVNGSVNNPVFSYCQLCHIEDRMAREYLQTEINDRVERKLSKIADILADMDVELEKNKECMAGILTLIKGSHAEGKDPVC